MPTFARVSLTTYPHQETRDPHVLIISTVVLVDAKFFITKIKKLKQGRTTFTLNILSWHRVSLKNNETTRNFNIAIFECEKYRKIK